MGRAGGDKRYFYAIIFLGISLGLIPLTEAQEPEAYNPADYYGQDYNYYPNNNGGIYLQSPLPDELNDPFLNQLPDEQVLQNDPNPPAQEAPQEETDSPADSPAQPDGMGAGGSVGGFEINNGLVSFSLSTSVQVEPSTGSATLSIPVPVPPGRGGIQPNLSLIYNSSLKNGPLGVGWMIDLGHIQRSTKRGAPKYNSTDTLVLVQNGSTQELVDAGSGFYRSKIEGSFMRIEEQGNGWGVTDKSGIKYYFGNEPNTSIEFGTSRFYQWNLQKVEDVHRNSMDIRYTKDGNYLYPSQILYTGNLATGEAPYAKVEFELEDRPDPEFSYQSGYRITISKRIREIRVKVGEDLQARYVFEYEGSTATGRSLLTRVLKYGADPSEGPLPPITFSYHDEKGFVRDDTWVIPRETAFSGFVPDQDYRDLGVRVADLNSDGYPDLVRAFVTVIENDLRANQYTYGGGRAVYIHDKNRSWQKVDSWIWPENCQRWVCTDFTVQAPSLTQSNRPMDLGLRIADVDGDGDPDLVHRLGAYLEGSVGEGLSRNQTYINQGDRFGENSNPWNEPSGVFFMEHWRYYDHNSGEDRGNAKYLGTELTDVNNDGYVDIVQSKNSDPSVHAVYLNNRSEGGTGWRLAPEWQPPANRYTDLSDGAVLADLNGDGLVDFLFRNPSSSPVDKVYMNTGRGWEEDPNTPWFDWGNFTDGSSQLADINGDGLADLIIHRNANDGDTVAINTGHGWRREDAWRIPEGDFKDLGIRLMDLDADGMLDVMVHFDNEAPRVYRNQGRPADLLYEVDNGIGAVTNIEYDSSAHYEHDQSEGAFLPFVVPVVSSVTVETDFGDSYTTDYVYKNGKWDTVEREFRGFGEVLVMDAEGNYSRSRYHQDEWFKGRMEWQEQGQVISAEGLERIDQKRIPARAEDYSIYTRTENRWAQREISAGVRFVYLEKTDSLTFDGDTSARRTAQSFEYDAYGNLTRAVQMGEVDPLSGEESPATAGDTRTVMTEYHNNTEEDTWLLGIPKRTRILGYDGGIRRESRFYYDSAEDIEAMPVKGLLTRKEDSDGDEDPANDPKTRFRYNAYGNLTDTWDPMAGDSLRNPDDRPTHIEYDPNYHLLS